MAFDYVIVGAGAAGLSLATHLAAATPRDRSVLLIEQNLTRPIDHAWAFWVEGPTPLDSVIQRSWQLRFVTSKSDRVLDTHRHRYAVLRGSDFRRQVHAQLSMSPGVVCLERKVERVVDGRNSASVVLDDDRTYEGAWVFDSRFALPRSKPDHPASLWQSFEGWEIETAELRCDESVATLMDFRTPQAHAMCFVYVLPMPEHRALVEHVTCGECRPGRAEQVDALAGYLGHVLGIHDYRIVHHERGATPLIADALPRRVGARVMTIGIAGGRIKPSTGYAFMRIQRDSAAIIRSLQRFGHPFAVPPDSRRHRSYDAVLLELIRSQTERVEEVFDCLFAHNPLDRIFRFLDETTTLAEEAMLPAWFWLPALAPSWIERSAA